MKNKKLINLLMQENLDAEVVVAYDSMRGQYDNFIYDNFIMARDRTNGNIYLACEDAESIDLASNDWLELIPLELCCTDSLVDENKRLRAEVDRLTRERAELYTLLLEARKVINDGLNAHAETLAALDAALAKTDKGDGR